MISSDWLRERMQDEARKKMPEDFLLMDEMFAMIEVARTVSVKLPAMEKKLKQIKLSAYYRHNGSAAMDPEELIRKAMCIAAVTELVNGGWAVEDARKFVAKVSCQEKTSRWHKDYKSREFTEGFSITLHNQVHIFRGILKGKCDQLSIKETVIELFS